MKYQFITIEGNIGAGKTSLAKMLSNDLRSKLILEQFSDNPFLPLFYQNPKQYAFTLEMSFMAERYQQIQEHSNQKDLFQNTIVSDYLFFKSLIFAKITLNEQEFELYQKMFHIVYPTVAEPDLIIYLHTPVKKLLENIKQRGRDYEQNIDIEYLSQVQDMYFQFLKNQAHLKVLILDASKIDFVNNHSDYQSIVELLKNDYAMGINHISLQHS